MITKGTLEERIDELIEKKALLADDLVPENDPHLAQQFTRDELKALFVGVGGASFCVFTLWLPEQYRTECRASAFATSSGRFVAAGATLLVGAGVARYGSIGVPVAMTALPFLAGLALLPWAEETRGKPLPG